MSAISIRLRQINTPSDTGGRVNLDTIESGRTDEIRAGKSNVGIGQILIFDADGDPNVIPESENNRTDNVGWDVHMVVGPNENSRNATVVIGKVGDGKFEWSGAKVPFEAIREEVDAKRHFNVAHLRVLEGVTGEAFFRQWRVSGGVRYASEWLGANDGRGFRIGRQ